MNISIEQNVPMQTRDGVQLLSDVYRPAAHGAFPVILMRTPYDKGAVLPGQGLNIVQAAQAGFVVVVQDTRGRFASAGDFRPLEQEAEDGYDAMAWAAAQPWSTGAVGVFGQSYLGTTAWRAAAQSPPALRAMATPVTPATFQVIWPVTVVHINWAARCSGAHSCR